MVTGLLGDVLSYIRLYALGLAGGMLGNAFNIMGTMILDIPIPALNWVFCIVILIFGHVLNLAMSCLGAFVHPLRLTFVEVEAINHAKAAEVSIIVAINKIDKPTANPDKVMRGAV